MKVIVIFIIALIAMGSVLLLWVRSLPVMHKVTVQKTINAPIEKVWSIMTSWDEQTTWRNGIKKIEIIDDNNFIEYPNKGKPIKFKIIEEDPPNFLKLAMSGSLEGSYVAKLEKKNGATIVMAQEEIVQESLLGRLLMKLFFDLEDFANNYLDQLTIYAEDS